MRFTRVAAAVGSLALLAAVVAAEDAARVVPGDRVRVATSAAEARLVGTLVSLDDESLSLRVAEEERPRVLPREQVTALAVSAGRRSRGRGALIGAGIGAVAGVAIGLASGDDPADNWVAFSAGEKAGAGAVLLGAIGGLVGLLVPPSERWKDVPLGRVRLAVQPVRGRGAAVSLTVAF